MHSDIFSQPDEPFKYEERWNVPVIPQDGHLQAHKKFLSSNFYPSKALYKLHQQFTYPFSGKLYHFLRKAGLQDLKPETPEHLVGLVATCEPWQRIKNAPMCFPIQMGHEAIRFYARAYIDILYLEDRPALHVVDEHTRSSAARFFSKLLTEPV